MGDETKISVTLDGQPEALAKLARNKGAVSRGARRATRDTTLSIRGRAKDSMGGTGRPRYGTGRLSRGIVDSPPEAIGDFSWLGRVGVLAIVPYGRILELGGMQPARYIRPVRKQVLRWVSGTTRLANLAGLGFGPTRRQAFGQGRKFRKGEALAGDVHFFRPSARKPAIYQEARYQRAIPFLGPAFQEELPAIPGTYKRRIFEALGVGEVSEGLGEG